MNKVKNILLLLVTAITASLIFIACDGGGGNNGGNQNGQTTTINGQVSNVIAMKESGDKSIKFAELMEMLSFIKDAKAQNGITVSAIIDGVTVDTTVTDPDGSFTLHFLLNSAKNVTLSFDIDGTIVTVSITVQEGSIIDLVIVIDLNSPPGDEVDIVDMGEAQGPLRCENGTHEINKNPGEDLVIDGGGEDCIRTEGNCNLIIDPENIILTNCARCIDARGTSQVTLTTPEGDIFCDAFENGIRTVGNANVLLDANGNLNVSADENGAKAEGNSVISFSADACVFNSGEDTFDTNGNATIDSSGCGEIIENPSPTPGPDL
jgi:hypothetical protein